MVFHYAELVIPANGRGRGEFTPISKNVSEQAMEFDIWEDALEVLGQVGWEVAAAIHPLDLPYIQIVLKKGVQS